MRKSGFGNNRGITNKEGTIGVLIVMILLVVVIPVMINRIADHALQAKKNEKIVLHPSVTQRPSLELTIKGRVQRVLVTIEPVGDRMGQFPSQSCIYPGLMLLLLPERARSSFCLILTGNPGEEITITGQVKNHQNWGKSDQVSTAATFSKNGEANLTVYVDRIYKDHIHFE
ncbi:TPA: hypothetical protein DD449_03655 [Candidatus Berkelbacteria bacterium]|uniref:Uncharacterized protein n=1 Tax=Berkelbacteria bacterium GW2011_GWE1_39_12 TaxID=1618337 RepID=A0A0G4B2Q4_9BACT|nr:MAG: hypothetical protein UT28_C0001G0365 [Berkelbacteria bacterium GW2011_GWE1_39_12]HBO60753.1 hypothetical protein [Candidatus Berkelbacteria bacterium]